MTYISTLQQIVPETFPWVSLLQLEKIQQILRQKSTRLARLKKAESEAFSLEDDNELAKLNTLQTVCTEILAKEREPNDNIVLLFTQCDSVSQIIRLKEYINFLSTALTHEESPLPLLINLRIEDPLQFAGVLIYLLNNDITAGGIFHSGLLHLFFEANSDNMEQVLKAYRILTDSVQTEDTIYLESRALLNLASEEGASTHPFFIHYALNGQYYPLPFQALKGHMPPLSFTISTENLNHLSTFLGPSFLLLALQQYSTNQNTLLQAFIFQALENMSIEALMTFYRGINTQMAQQERIPLFIQLGTFLNDARMDELFKQKGYKWIALISRPTLLESLSHHELQKLSTSPLNVQDIEYVSRLLNDPKLSHHLNQIYRQIYALLLRHPELVTDDSPYINLIDTHTETTSWCLQDISILRDELISGILQFGFPFTADSYMNINDIYRINKSKSDLLMQLNTQQSDYPQGNYELQTFIIRELFRHSPSFDLLSCLDGIHPVENYESYTPEDRILAKCRTLYECLTTENNPSLQTVIIHHLKTVFGEHDWMHATPGHTPLIEKALLKGNCALLQYYFPLNMTEIDRLDQLEAIEEQLNQQNKTLLQFVCSNSLAFTIALSLYPEAHRLEAWLKTNANGDTLLHYAARLHPDNLALILALHPVNEYLHLLMEKNDEGNTVLHEVDDFNTFHVILAACPEHQRLLALLERNHQDEAVVHKVIEKPDLLQSIFNGLSHDQRMQVLQITKGYQKKTLLHCSYHQPASFKIILESLPADQRLRALNSGNYVTHNTLKHAATSGNRAIVEIILTALTTNECIELMIAISENFSFYMESQNTLVHDLQNHPDLLVVFLKALPKERRQQILRVKNKEGKTPLQALMLSVNQLQTILNELPEEHRFATITENDKKGKTLLHSISQSTDKFQTILNTLPIEQQRAAVMVTSQCGNSLLHSACHNLDVTTIILALYPEHLRLNAIMLQNNEGDTPLHLIAYNATLALLMLNLYPEHLRLNAILVKNYRGETVLHTLNNPEANIAMLATLPENHRIEALNATDNQGNTILHIKTSLSNTDNFLALLSIYPIEQRADALKRKNNFGNNILHVENVLLEFDLKSILTTLPEAHRFDVITDTNPDGDTILHLTALYAPNVARNIIESLPKEERFAALIIKNLKGNTSLDLLRQRHHPDIVSTILTLLPEAESHLLLPTGALANLWLFATQPIEVPVPSEIQNPEEMSPS